MHVALLVHVFQGLDQLLHIEPTEVLSECTRACHYLQKTTLMCILLHKICGLVILSTQLGLTLTEVLNDVLMFEFLRNFDLRFDQMQVILVENLDGNLPAGLLILSEVHLTLGAIAELLENLEMINLSWDLFVVAIHLFF